MFELVRRPNFKSFHRLVLMLQAPKHAKIRGINQVTWRAQNVGDVTGGYTGGRYTYVVMEEPGILD